LATYGEAAAERTVASRLHLRPPSGAVTRRPWPLRITDLDVLGHVNNAAVWAPVEDECARRSVEPAIIDLEFAGALLGDDDVMLESTVGADGLDLWLAVGGEVRVAARVRSAD
jgi:hypothetical protein